MRHSNSQGRSLFFDTQIFSTSSFQIHHSSENQRINEICYGSHQLITSHFLFPFLQHLTRQHRWQLWLTVGHKINRNWLTQTGLPESKIVQAHNIIQEDIIIAAENALSSGCFSAVVVCSKMMNNENIIRLQHAAQKGNAYVFFIHPITSSLALFSLPSSEENTTYH